MDCTGSLIKTPALLKVLLGIIIWLLWKLLHVDIVHRTPCWLQADRTFYSFKVLCTGLSHKQKGCTLENQDVHYFDPYDLRDFSPRWLKGMLWKVWWFVYLFRNQSICKRVSLCYDISLRWVVKKWRHVSRSCSSLMRKAAAAIHSQFDWELYLYSWKLCKFL